MRKSSSAAIALCLIAMLLPGVLFAQSTNAIPNGPKYTADGKQLKLPTGFENWIFVGANLGLGYSDEAKAMTSREAKRSDSASPGSFHNIYIQRAAFKAYQQTGNFPEETILVMDVYSAKDKEPQGIVDRGFFEGKRQDIEVAVKNSKRPDKTADSKGEWAYYIFPLKEGKPAKTATAFADKSCYDCHKVHAADDNVWVQFYPILQREKK